MMSWAPALLRSLSAGVMSSYPPFSWTSTVIPSFFPTAVMPSAPCWSQPRLVRLAGVMRATLVTFSAPGPGVAAPGVAWALTPAALPRVISSIATMASNRPNRFCKCFTLSLLYVETVASRRDSFPFFTPPFLINRSSHASTGTACIWNAECGGQRRAPGQEDKGKHDADIGRHADEFDVTEI